MDPISRQARRMAPGAYLGKGTDPTGEGVLNKRAQKQAELYRNPGLVAPGEQSGVPNNPLNFTSHGDAATPMLRSNPYGDWQKLDAGTSAIETQPTPPAAKLIAQPWQVDAQQDLENGVRTLSQLQARSGPSPIHMAPNEWVLSNQPPALEGISGYQAQGMLPSAPLMPPTDLQMPTTPTAQAPWSSGTELDPRYAPYTVMGQPSDGKFPSVGQTVKPGRGKPATMPQSQPN